MAAALSADLTELLHQGCVIPAHPLALTPARRLDERRQHALTRYYLAAGAGGLAVGVHTTQFAVRDPDVALLAPVLELAARTVTTEADRPVLLIAGACGPTAQAVAEAELAVRLGYHAVLLSPGGLDDWTEDQLIERTAKVAEVLPVIGFYLQPDVGGRPLSYAYWRRLAEIPGVVAIKIAAFDRYATFDVVRAVAASGRGEDIALYTGNDDNYLVDLLTPYRIDLGGEKVVTRRIVGGLLGQWAVWTRRAVELHTQVRAATDASTPSLSALLPLAPALTDANASVFDAAHGFAGCVPGIHEILRRQGLLAGTWCLDPDERLSPGQSAELDRVVASYPELTDDAFVAENLDAWLK